MNHRKLFGALVLLIVLIVLFFVSLYLRGQVPQEQLPTDSNTQSQSEESANGYFYKFVSSYDPDAPFETLNEKNYDGKIIKVDQESNEETIVIESIKEAYPPIKASFNYSLLPMDIQGIDPDHIYFNLIAYETDGGLGRIIKFDGKGNTIKELGISEYYHNDGAKYSQFGPYAASVINPDNQSDVETLYLLDFEKDKAIALETLPKNRTYNVCSFSGCMSGLWTEIEWLDETSFQIKIYESKPGPIDPQTGTPTPILVENKVFKIN